MKRDDFSKSCVHDRVKRLGPNFGSKHPIDNVTVSIKGGERHVLHRHAVLAMSEELVKHRITRFHDDTVACLGGDRGLVSIVGKFFLETEGAILNPPPDVQELLISAPEICLTRAPLERWTISDTFEFKIELNPIGTLGLYTAEKRLSSHFDIQISLT